MFFSVFWYLLGMDGLGENLHPATASVRNQATLEAEFGTVSQNLLRGGLGGLLVSPGSGTCSQSRKHPAEATAETAGTLTIPGRPLCHIGYIAFFVPTLVLIKKTLGKPTCEGN